MKVMVKDLRVNQLFTSFFLLESFGLRRTKSGREFLFLRLSDRTGRVIGYLWEEPESFLESLRRGTFLKVRGVPRILNGSLVLDIWRIRKAEAREVKVRDFFEMVPGGISHWFERLLSFLKMIEERNCRRLIEAFLRDKEFLESLRLSPAGLSYHHSYIGGLLEHTVSTMSQGIIASERLSGLIDRDLLLTGCFLHDIGKTKELNWGLTRGYTTEGRLLGHIFLGLLMLEEKRAQLREFPGELSMLLRHMVVSHHGRPIKPLTPEAIVLHLIEGSDATLNHLWSHLRYSDPNREWSHYDRFLKTEIYLKKFSRKILS